MLTSPVDPLLCQSMHSSVLPYGLGRSYGDSCLNSGQTLLMTRGLDRFIAFDRENGIICCEAGVSFEEILTLIVPRQWFLPVTPGTKHITVGGAIANDVHGKNHHRDGTFSHWVKRFELLRSNGEKLLCSPSENVEFFYATIGGLGLTGLITWAEFQLRKIANSNIQMDSFAYDDLNEFFAKSSESEKDFTYTVGWVDSLASRRNLGRGVFFRGNHALASNTGNAPKKKSSLGVPFDFPTFALNPWTVRAFNSLYYGKHRFSGTARLSHYETFFYPLDALRNWNRIYGSRGFYQYQCVVPKQTSLIQEILSEIARSKRGSFLTVLKSFGERPSLGMLSFPRAGVTLAMDFANKGSEVLRLFERLDAIVRSAQGAVYPAKDARMSSGSFRTFFPRWEEFSLYVDPKFSSSFWRRVVEKK